MARDKLGVLLTIRQRTVDQARQGLAACLKLETAAMEAVRAIDDAMSRERALADRFAEQPHGMEIFAAWLKRVAADRVNAVAALAEAERRTVASRAELVAARSAARTVECTIEERAIMARAELERRDQHTLDDVTRGQPR